MSEVIFVVHFCKINVFSLICEWVKVAWEEVKTEAIVKSFLKCGISNAMMATTIMLSGLSDEYSIDSKDPFADLDSEHEGFATVSE